jgi:rubrerythrin
VIYWIPETDCEGATAEIAGRENGDQVQAWSLLVDRQQSGLKLVVQGTMQMQDIENALTVIRLAIHNEISGQRFYNDASFYCIDPWAKDVFASLAQEEETHTHLLLAEYEALQTHGRWLDADAALASGAEIDITRFTFPDDESADELFPPQWSAGETIDRRADDLAALAFGIQMEQQAIALYGEQADRNTDPAARKAYRFLVQEETRHYRQLKGQWEKIAGMPFVER